MKQLYDGKTKTVLLDEATGVVNLFFKDSATGENGVFDPGSNSVGGSVEGKGKIGLKISKHFFEIMEKNGIPTHYLAADIDQNLMQVRKLTVPKLEFVLRYFTAGSMCRRFDLEEGIVFDPPYTEVTLKSDAQGDPLISERLCIMKGLLAPGQGLFPAYAGGRYEFTDCTFIVSRGLAREPTRVPRLFNPPQLVIIALT